MIKLVAALGNPGFKYADTRHNIGWMVVECLSFADELHWQQKFNGQYAAAHIDGEKILFLKPETYMNLSGRSVGPAAQFFDIEVEEILVIHDDLELPFGVLGFKQGGGLGGHNGLRSVTAALGSQDFNRLRLGISRPDHSDITAHVLSPFSEDEAALLPPFLEEAATLLEQSLTADFHTVAARFRKEKIIDL
jgi:PTH1 family peptidyl-tRNA hydrolase